MTATAVEKGTALRPLADRVVVRVIDKENSTVSGLVIPDTVEQSAVEGTVVATGPGRRSETGDIIPLEVAAGDTAVFSRFAGVKVADGEGEVVVISQSDIIAVRASEEAVL